MFPLHGGARNADNFRVVRFKFIEAPERLTRAILDGERGVASARCDAQKEEATHNVYTLIPCNGVVLAVDAPRLGGTAMPFVIRHSDKDTRGVLKAHLLAAQHLERRCSERERCVFHGAQ